MAKSSKLPLKLKKQPQTLDQAIDHARPLKGSLRMALSSYRTVIRSMLLATLTPLVIIGLFRLASDDYTGDEYSILIGLISLFTTLLIARIATVGWDRKATKLSALYSAVMSRLLAGIGLFMIVVVHTLPLIIGVLLLGVSLVGEVSIWVALPGVLLILVGFFLLIGQSFAIFSLMEDLSLSVWQSYRISLRLTRRNWKGLAWRALVAMVIFSLIAVGLTFAGALLAGPLQNPFVAIVVDGALSWIITPFVIFYLSILFRRLVQSYE